MVGELAEEVRRSPGLSLKPVYPSVHWLTFPDQWEAKSPWHDRRVRQAVNLAIDRPAINQVRTFGLSKNTGTIVASSLDFYWPAPVPPFEPARAKHSWPRPAIRTASTRATSTATCPRPRPRRP
jgi:peptide/nickel transport system substrate-binding protein